MKIFMLSFIGVVLFCNEVVFSDNWPPTGTAISIPISRDTWLSAVGSERNGSNGGAKQLKLKGQQEMVLLDIDHSELKGKLITGAILHIRSSRPEKAPLARLGISTVGRSWVEGGSTRYRAQSGTSCFVQAQYDARNWAYKGSTMMDVVFGRGHTLWKFSDCSAPDGEGWQACAVDPDVMAARVAGLSHGFCLFDEVGSIGVWGRAKPTN